MGYYDKSKFPADLDGALVGSGQAWYDGGASELILNYLKVHVPYDGKVFEVANFQFLCSHQLLYHNTFPTINWVTVSNGVLPPNAVAAGVAPNGEVLYVCRGRRA